MEEQRVGNFLKQIDFELVQSTLLLKITSVGNEGRQGLMIRKMWIRLLTAPLLTSSGGGHHSLGGRF